jgi:hypothetical protein
VNAESNFRKQIKKRLLHPFCKRRINAVPLCFITQKTGNGVRPRILLLHSWAHFARLSIELLSSGGSSSLDGGILVLLFPFIVGTLITRGILPAQAGDCQAESKRKLRNSPLEFVHLPDFA